MATEKQIEKRIYKEIGFKEHVYPKKCCCNCGESYCHNPGAAIRGLSCRLIESMGKVALNESHFCSVVEEESVCKRWTKKGKG